jgi:chemotaxis protein MotB
MPEGDNHELVIIRRRGDAGVDAVKGGVWKIAFADFMTAMMCFFLVMWLINAANEETKQAVASYFNPIKLANLNTKGLNDPKVVEEGPAADSKAKGSPAPDQLHEPDPEATDPHAREEALFRDPYAVLAEIASGAAESEGRKSPGGGSEGGEGRSSGMDGGAAFRDPFDPAFWQESKAAEVEPADDTADAVDAAGAAAGEAPETPAEHAVGADGPADGAERGMAVSHPDEEPTARADLGENPAPPGGTEDSVALQDHALAQAEAVPQVAQADEAGDETPSELERQLAEALENRAESGPTPNIEVARSGEGVLISLTDDVSFGMFSVGSAEPSPEVVRIMARIAELLKTQPGDIVIRGHTDARPFRSDTYDNWRLSSARAQMAYYMLVRAGLDEKRVERIEGHADRDLKVPSDPEAAENRRIEILVREVPS